MSAPVSAPAIISAVLAAATSDSAFGVLSVAVTAGLAAEPITPSTALSDARRAYMRLAAIVHPDKNPGLATATDAFQALVKAFESIADGSAAAASAQAATSSSTTSAATGAGKAATSQAKARKPPAAATSTAPSTPSAAPSSVERAKAPAPAHTGAVSSSGQLTVIECPRCKLPWQMDTPVLYALFMHHNMKVHCDTCLLQFGCATAIHQCPCCKKRHSEYSGDMYFTGCPCPHCHRTYVPKLIDVSEKVLVDFQAAETARRDREERDRERAQRAAQRAGCDSGAAAAAGGVDEDRVLQLVGECMVDEKCPICRKAVMRKAREHVMACMKNPPAPSKRKTTVSIVGDDGDEDTVRRKKATARKAAAKKPKTALAPKKK